ncbi:hypothetical protein EIP91_006773 [Steccherinum ochraceum]|uniref:cAMP-independent regulatory protein pac2 n=1 Tax=Steccherinum ochraceum TaxID=92696 RepID=A0A4R0R7W8_9APHY|nr:hypothetical protein EIP91_006773 [Steccherinum ochraceum]
MARRSAPPHSGPAYYSAPTRRIVDPNESAFSSFMREQVWAPEKLPGNINIVAGLAVFFGGIFTMRTWGELMLARQDPSLPTANSGLVTSWAPPSVKAQDQKARCTWIRICSLVALRWNFRPPSPALFYDTFSDDVKEVKNAVVPVARHLFSPYHQSMTILSTTTTTTTTCSAASGMQAKDTMFRAWIQTTYDALLVFEAARRGVVPRVTRRFHDAEKRSMIVSGAVLVFTEEESGIKRWTDPFVWSASRMLGNFMIYREREDVVETPISPYSRSAVSVPTNELQLVHDPELERCIYGSWNRGRGLKANGLMKKTISLPVDGVLYHLVSYYSPSEVLSGKLQTPSLLDPLASLELGNEIMHSISRLRHPPRMEIDHDGRATYIGEEENLTSLYTPHPSRSPRPSRSSRLPRLPTLQTSEPHLPDPLATIMQPAPRRFDRQSISEDSSNSAHHGSNSMTQPPSVYNTNSLGASEIPLRTPRATSAQGYNPYRRPHESCTERYKLRSKTSTCPMSVGSSSSTVARFHAYAPSPTSSNYHMSSATSPISGMYDQAGASLYGLPPLLGGSSTVESHSTVPMPHDPAVTALWNSTGASADWVYQEPFHPTSANDWS